LHAINRAAVRDEKIISQVWLPLIKIKVPGEIAGHFSFAGSTWRVVKRPG
jgi:hypothetical protein